MYIRNDIVVMNEFLSSKLTKRRVLQTGTHLEEAHQDCYWTSPCITKSMHVRKNTQVHGDAPDLSKNNQCGAH